ncbi:hypothetical protein ACWEPN_42730, partial [Nonomuraea wenchangensis]
TMAYLMSSATATATAASVTPLPPRRHPAHFMRLAAHLPRLDAIGVEYRRADGPLPWQRRPGVPGRPEDAERWRAKLAAWTANLPQIST